MIKERKKPKEEHIEPSQYIPSTRSKIKPRIIENTLQRSLKTKKKFIHDLRANSSTKQASRYQKVKSEGQWPPKSIILDGSNSLNPSGIIGPKFDNFQLLGQPFGGFREEISCDAPSDCSIQEKGLEGHGKFPKSEKVKDEETKLTTIGTTKKSGAYDLEALVRQNKARQSSQMLGSLFGGKFFK